VPIMESHVSWTYM